MSDLLGYLSDDSPFDGEFYMDIDDSTDRLQIFTPHITMNDITILHHKFTVLGIYAVMWDEDKWLNIFVDSFYKPYGEYLTLADKHFMTNEEYRELCLCW